MIDRHPITFSLNTPLLEVVAQMRQALGRDCSGVNINPNTGIDFLSSEDRQMIKPAEPSCALIIDGMRLIGIFTERDLLRLVATGTDLTAVRISEPNC